jgi:tetratricopeptide (TPR) repeat protein
MMKLEPPDSHYVSAAIGWLGLGSAADARAELAQVSPENQNLPDILELRWEICVRETRWEEAVTIARRILQEAPDRASGFLHLAYAIRRVPDGSVRQASETLLPAFDKFPKLPLISFNLSCYACQLNQLEAARVWLKRAFVIGGKDKMKPLALADSDLQPLWDEIREM